MTIATTAPSRSAMSIVMSIGMRIPADFAVGAGDERQ